MTDSTPPGTRLHALRGAGSPLAEGGRATSPPPLRRAAPGIRGPRTCGHGGRGINHLGRIEGPSPPSRTPRAPTTPTRGIYSNPAIWRRRYTQVVAASTLLRAARRRADLTQ